MVALCNRACHYIFVLWFLFLSSSFFFSSPNLSGRRLYVCHTSTHDVVLVWIYGMHVWNVMKIGLQDAKLCQKSPLRTIAQLCRAISSQLRHVSTIKKKLVKWQDLLHISSRYGPLTDEICWRVWGTSANFNGFRALAWIRYCSDVAQHRSTKLCTMFVRLLDWYTVYTFLGLLIANGCKIHFASKSYVLLYL